MSDGRPPVDLAALVLLGARAGGDLLGLGDAWRTAETALVAEIARAPRRALRVASRFEALARRCGESEARGRAARVSSSAFAHLGRWKESAAAARRAEGLLEGPARDGARLGRATALLRLGRTREAATLCRRVRNDAERRGDALLAAGARLNEAGARHEAGDPAHAVPLYRAAREAFAQLGRPALAARAAEAAANALVLLDRFDEARALLDAAASSFAAAGLARESANARYNLGELLVATDRLGDAEETLLAAEEELRAAGDLPTADLARVARGAALLRARLLPEARRVLEAGEKSLDDRAPPVERTRARLLVARAQLAEGDAAAARRTLAKPLAVRSAETLGARDEILGRALAAEGRPGPARSRLLAAAKRAGARPSARARSLAAAAVCATESGDASTAARLAASAERAARGLPVPSLLFASAAASFLAESARGRRSAADAALRRAFDGLEEVRSGLGGDAMRAALLTGSERWLARAVRHVLDGPGGAREALDLVERWRARALLDLLDAGTLLVGDEPSSRRELREHLAVLERRLEGEPLPGFLRSGAPAPRSGTRGIAAAESRLLRAAIDETLAASPRAARAIDSVLADLEPGTVVVAPFSSEDGGGSAFVAAHGSVRVVRGLGTDEEIASLVEELLFRAGKAELGADRLARWERRLAAEWDTLLHALAARTLTPLREHLSGARRLVVVPSGPWHRIPFAALPFEGGRLCERVATAFAPSLAALSANVPEAVGPAVVVGAADARAPSIANEARSVAAALPGSRLVLGDDATRAALDCGDGAPSCVHLAAHGRFRADAPALSGVRLADGWLRACELRGLPLGGSLVVLSGCDTGVARIAPGGEVHGLVRGLLAAGAAEALLGLWRVEDAATSEWMAAFHAERAAGAPSEEALRRVQARGAVAFRDTGRLPSRWAGFALWTRRLNPPRGVSSGLARERLP